MKKLRTLIDLGKTHPKEWPHQGEIVFMNFNLRYSQDMPYVLKNLNVTIRPMEKVIQIVYHIK